MFFGAVALILLLCSLLWRYLLSLEFLLPYIYKFVSSCIYVIPYYC